MERTYIIPLRKEYRKAPIYKQTKRAVSAARTFLQKHMKHDNVKLGRHLNMFLWKNGNRNPPHKVEVHAELVKDKEGDYIYAELVGKEKEQLKFDVVEKKEGLAGKLEALTGSKDKPEPKAEATKVEEKKEKEKILKEVPLKKEKAADVLGGHDAKKEEQEKARQEGMVNRDNKQERKKKE